jgi:penicillin-binding protein 2
LYDKLGKTWYYGNTLSASIGQAENNFTPIQIAKYISMFANGGNDIDVSIINKIVDTNGKKLDENEIQEDVNKKLGLTKNTDKEKIELNDEYLNQILKGMKSVTTETGGTAYSVFKNFKVELRWENRFCRSG